ncbi:hypothetical protein SNE40_005270 [Patella caerulea]|uniref:Uncharacterized protein n=1 Tax=Patella caerulea TaxID=87958 RepID=A0AAN8K112_PATCE
MIPIFTVEKSGFRNMMKTFDPRYCLPGRKYFSDIAIPALYNTVHDKVLEEIRRRPVCYLGATTDMWSSRNMEPYLGVTVHFIDEDWRLNRETCYFSSDHTAENLALGLRQISTAWDFRETGMVCLKTDNGANTIKAASLNNYLRLQCFEHRLNLAINNALIKDQRIDKAVASCVKVVSAFSYSW